MRLRQHLHIWLLLASATLGGCGVQPTHTLVSAPGSVHQQLFDAGWKFDLADPSGAEAVGFDDAGWRTVNVPHDWSIEQPFDSQWASATGFLPGGIGWYRKHFTLTPEQRNKTVTVRFDGVYKDAITYINGHKLAERPYGYSSFEYDLTPFLNQTGDNVLAVRVDHHDFADSRWYPGSGIYRHVYLTATPPVHVARYGNVVTSTFTEKSATIHIETTVQNDSDQNMFVQVDTRILDHKGGDTTYITPFDVDHPISIPARGSKVIARDLTIAHPDLWSTERPAVYTAVTKVGCPGGCQYDATNTPFGIRDAKFDPNTGFWLNGMNMKLKGVCLHEDAGALGSAVPQQVWERRLLILRSAGVNAIRCSHNPPAPEFLDLCDRMGFLVMDEAFDEWNAPTFTGQQGKKKWVDSWSGTVATHDGYHSVFDQWADTDIKDMVLRDRNHPSIIMWSIGNEIDYPNDPYPPNNTDLAPVAQRLIADVKAVDTTRPVTASCAAIGTNAWYQDLDIVGYNYQESRYAADHAAMPAEVIFGSENGMGVSAWNAVAQNPFVSAQFLWTGIDYLGEAGRPAPNKAWPERARPDGLLDLAGFRKPAYYFRKSLWTDAPMVKIEANLPETDRNNRVVVPAGLACYTNCDTVAFSQNGKVLGELPLPARTHIIRVPGDPAAGPIQAVGKKAGAEAAKDTYALAGPLAKVDLWEYPSILGPGDGPNVEQIELTLEDASGNVVRDASNLIGVTIDGPGRLLGMESGDISSHESYQASTHKAYQGRLLIYVETHGKVRVRADVAFTGLYGEI